MRTRSEPLAPLLAAVAVGGAIGALARYGLSVALPGAPGAWPVATWVTNVSGCLLMGVLMASVVHVWPRQRYLRPFIGTGVLGGYTTFSTAMVDVHRLVQDGAPGLALLYLGGTAVTALAATAAGWYATTAVLR